MKYEPYGQVDLKDQWINPWFNLIGWLIDILCIWYNHSHLIKEMTYRQPEYSWEKPVKVKMTLVKKCIIIFKCLVIDIIHNPYTSLGCSAFLLYLLIRCFLSY